MKEYDFAVIGGGITGLSAAYYLTKKGKKVIVLEKDRGLGGLVTSWDMGTYSIEKYYHHLSKNDVFFIGLLDELNLTKKLKWNPASVGYYYNGKVYKMDNPFQILRFEGLNFVDIIRLAFIVFRVKLKKDFSDLDEISAKEWIIKNGGDRAYNNFFAPLITAKFGKNLENVSAAWLFGRIKFRSKRSLKGETLGYMEKGFKEFVDKLVDSTRKNGAEILTNTEVRKIEIEKGRVTGLLTSEGEIKTKNVISTIPPKYLLKLCELPPEIKDGLEKIKYQYTVCALFGLTRQLLDGIYWLNIKSETIPFGALLEHTNFHNIPEYGDDNIVYAVSYLQDKDDPLWKEKEEDIIKSFVNGFKEVSSDFKEEHVTWWKLAKTPYSAPVYLKSHLKNIKEIQAPIKGLHITGQFMMYPERSMNDALMLVHELIKHIEEESN